ncbi:MAG: tetratricopeptide repeat protein [Blastocatellia bacterium]|nr:tetratricopeptide repeat protein [Blastocatellia bacterium]
MNALLLAFALGQTASDCGKHFAAGLQEYQRKDLNKALIAFRTATQCDPKLVQAYLAIADIYAERGNDSEALSALLQALEIEPKNVLALRAAANLYLKNDEHRKALPLLETLTSLTPQSAEVHADLAAAYATKGDHKEAEAEFRRALELRADYFPALAGLGNLLSRAGDDKAATPLLRKAAQLQPQSYEGHFLLGSTLNRLGQFEEARAELEQASKLGGANDPRVFYQLARAWGGLGKGPERRAALARFSELAKKQNDDEELQRKAAAWIDEARALLQTGDLESAAARLEMARDVKPGDATLLFRLAGLNFDLRRYDAAREYAQAAISLSPEVWLYHYLLGLVERSANHPAEARASLETAAKLQSTEAPVFNALGEVLIEQGERQAAIAAFEKAVKLAPNDAAFRQNLESARSKR